MRRVLSLVLILSLLAAALCLPAAARSSDYINRSDVKIAKSGTNSIAIKTTTGADSTMTSIGVTTIVIEQSANGTSWTPIRTYSSGKASRARWARSPRVLLFCCVYASSVESSSALMFIGGSMTGCSPGCVVSREIWLRI